MKYIQTDAPLPETASSLKQPVMPETALPGLHGLQPPQPEMEAEFRHILGRNCDILTLGALDHLDKDEITRHPPVSGEDTLYTTLPPDNSPVFQNIKATGH